MNIKQLEVLRTLLATGSTIATAKTMGLSHSGVSRLLQQLETAFVAHEKRHRKVRL
ncbi:LysR family transcriptional regulator, partial [Rhizobium johnstonii]|uniref:LysR family transcriptional regulator n=1 Tax=Rhizobium johnstonii TaxID=3019933 RepID=UPI003F978DAD